MQSPSSLIFLVLLGVWAAYFVQYWVRRRDHLATARSVEQFSAAMRVLERRPPVPRTDLSDPAPRSWAVHPARAARPEVVVKRAVLDDETPARVQRTAAASVSRPPAPGRPPSVRPVRRPTPAALRRVRGAALLVSLVGLVVVGLLAAFSVLQPWAPVIPAVALLASFAWVRAGVRAERAARLARRRRAREVARRRAAAAPGARSRQRPSARGSAPVGVSESAPERVTSAVPERAASAVPEQAVSPEDVSVATAESAPVAESALLAEEPEPVREEPEPVVEYVHLVDEDDIPLTWEPVPVPRPTYTMKERADRPEVAPAAVTPTPAPVETALPVHGDVEERRAAGA
ncbi:hypothetical protein H9L10_01180 [Phycicoccus endophyticus]|uniref:Uncharacterized protein n=2 Tax=Phycicoccus endophyticus TaxID=1690220 RepID=A0A7G9R2C0_9MICO|nr:hypothetical protein [Phycicoccus endophyticus]QNN49745.1 hypothetical protein H9L10_01180 [Phycicoccus endophyticus]